MKKFDNVYQFKVTLKGIYPKIWRKIQVPENYTFWDLHVAIQDVMGWDDSHLHLFEISGKEIGIPDEGDTGTLPGWKHKISDYFSMENKKALYTYDFGDNWEHDVVLEKILPRDKDTKYPTCIAGERACPPEDCGGTWSYKEFLEAIKDPKHEEHDEMLEWVGGEFDPEHFDPKEVYFVDPVEARKMRI